MHWVKSKCIIVRDFNRRIKIVKHLPKNKEIQADTVRLIDEDTKDQKIVSLKEALELAREQELDLVAVSPGSEPPVCKIMDYTHYLYNQSKIEKKAKKSSKSGVIKELKLSPKISDNDFNVRKNAAIKFLDKGYKIKVTLMFKGREITHSELGMNIMLKFIENLQELATVEQEPSINGKFIGMMLIPKKK